MCLADLKDLASQSLGLLKNCLFDPRFPALFCLDVYGSIIGMFELNNLGELLSGKLSDDRVHSNPSSCSMLRPLVVCNNVNLSASIPLTCQISCIFSRPDFLNWQVHIAHSSLLALSARYGFQSGDPLLWTLHKLVVGCSSQGDALSACEFHSRYLSCMSESFHQQHCSCPAALSC